MLKQISCVLECRLRAIGSLRLGPRHGEVELTRASIVDESGGCFEDLFSEGRVQMSGLENARSMRVGISTPTGLKEVPSACFCISSSRGWGGSRGFPS